MSRKDVSPTLATFKNCGAGSAEPAPRNVVIKVRCNLLKPYGSMADSLRRITGYEQYSFFEKMKA